MKRRKMIMNSEKDFNKPKQREENTTLDINDDTNSGWHFEENYNSGNSFLLTFLAQNTNCNVASFSYICYNFIVSWGFLCASFATSLHFICRLFVVSLQFLWVFLLFLCSFFGVSLRSLLFLCGFFAVSL